MKAAHFAALLGSYGVGQSYNGRYGKTYKLHGLDATNDKSEILFSIKVTTCLMKNKITK
jgi:hypothetical protein